VHFIPKRGLGEFQNIKDFFSPIKRPINKTILEKGVVPKKVPFKELFKNSCLLTLEK
jgi:hypothetical protein